MVNPAHHRPLRRERPFHLEGEVVEQLGAVLAGGALEVAQAGVEAHPLHKAQAEPGLQPGPQTDASGDFSEALGGDAGAVFGGRLVPQQVEIELEGEGPGLEQAPLQACAQQVVLAQGPLEDEGFAEAGVGGLAGPGRGRPGVGVPVRDRRQLGGAGQWRRRPQGLGRGHLRIEIHNRGGEVEHAVDVLHLPTAFDQVETQLAGLQELVAALKPHAAGGVHGAVHSVVFDPLGHQAAAGQQGRGIAGGHIAVDHQIEALLIGGDVEQQGRGGGGCRRRGRQICWGATARQRHRAGILALAGNRILVATGFVGAGIQCLHRCGGKGGRVAGITRGRGRQTGTRRCGRQTGLLWCRRQAGRRQCCGARVWLWLRGSTGWAGVARS